MKAAWVAVLSSWGLVGCGAAEPVDVASLDLPEPMQQGNCFRAADVTNYNIKDPDAAFVLTSRGFVYGLISQDCFRNNGDGLTIARPPRNDVWMCAGDQVEVKVSAWGSISHLCRAYVTQPLYDPAISGFRSRVAPPAGG